MISREIQIYGGLLTLALIIAFVAWQDGQSPKKPKSDSSVVILDLGKGDVSAVTLTQERQDTRIEVRGATEEDKWVWIARTERRAKRVPRTPPPSPVPSPVDGTSPEPSPSPTATPKPEFDETIKEFTGGNTTVAVIDRFTPFKASRKLGKVKPDQLGQFELDDPKMELVIETKRGKTYNVKVGSEATGGSNFYVLYDNKVYLVAQNHVKPLQGSVTAIMQKRVHQLSDRDLTEVEVTANNRTATFTHNNRRDAKTRFWSRKGEEDPKKDEQFATWLGKLRRIPIIQYVEEPPDNPPVAVKITYRSEDNDNLAWMEIVPSGIAGQKPWVRTENTRVWAEVNPVRIDEVMGELDAILAGSS